MSGMSARDVAAFLLDRADQYDIDSPCWIALADAAKDVVSGEVSTREQNGEFDAALYERVDRMTPALAKIAARVSPEFGPLDKAAAALREKARIERERYRDFCEAAAAGSAEDREIAIASDKKPEGK